MTWLHLLIPVASIRHRKKREMISFFRLHDSRYAIYFHQVTEAEVESIRKEVALSERKAMELANQTVDLIFPG